MTEKSIEGVSLKVGPLGESDRLLTFLSDQDGITRIAVPGARRPSSKLGGATAFTHLRLQLVGKRELKRVKHLKILKSYCNLSKNFETLSAGQAIAELCLLLVAGNDPIPGLVSTVLIHLDRLEEKDIAIKDPYLLTLAKSIQSCVHLLALGGYGLPLQNCCISGARLEPPIGDWDWRCSLIPDEGFSIGSSAKSAIELNPSEVALLQRLLRPNLPIKANGELMGPKRVWLRLLTVVECWIENHLSRKLSSLMMLRESIINY